MAVAIAQPSSRMGTMTAYPPSASRQMWSLPVSIQHSSPQPTQANATSPSMIPTTACSPSPIPASIMRFSISMSPPASFPDSRLTSANTVASPPIGFPAPARTRWCDPTAPCLFYLPRVYAAAQLPSPGSSKADSPVLTRRVWRAYSTSRILRVPLFSMAV